MPSAPTCARPGIASPVTRTARLHGDARPLAGIDVLLCVGSAAVDPRNARLASRLRAIVSAVTGVDGVDIAAATEHTVVIANAQTEENVIGMAEATVLLMLAALYDLDGARRTGFAKACGGRRN